MIGEEAVENLRGKAKVTHALLIEVIKKKPEKLFFGQYMAYFKDQYDYLNAKQELPNTNITEELKELKSFMIEALNYFKKDSSFHDKEKISAYEMLLEIGAVLNEEYYVNSKGSISSLKPPPGGVSGALYLKDKLSQLKYAQIEAKYPDNIDSFERNFNVLNEFSTYSHKYGLFHDTNWAWLKDEFVKAYNNSPTINPAQKKQFLDFVEIEELGWAKRMYFDKNGYAHVFGIDEDIPNDYQDFYSFKQQVECEIDINSVIGELKNKIKNKKDKSVEDFDSLVSVLVKKSELMFQKGQAQKALVFLYENVFDKNIVRSKTAFAKVNKQVNKIYGHLSAHPDKISLSDEEKVFVQKVNDLRDRFFIGVDINAGLELCRILSGFSKEKKTEQKSSRFNGGKIFKSFRGKSPRNIDLKDIGDPISSDEIVGAFNRFNVLAALGLKGREGMISEVIRVSDVCLEVLKKDEKANAKQIAMLNLANVSNISKFFHITTPLRNIISDRISQIRSWKYSDRFQELVKYHDVNEMEGIDNRAATIFSGVSVTYVEVLYSENVSPEQINKMFETLKDILFSAAELKFNKGALKDGINHMFSPFTEGNKYNKKQFENFLEVLPNFLLKFSEAMKKNSKSKGVIDDAYKHFIGKLEKFLQIVKDPELKQQVFKMVENHYLQMSGDKELRKTANAFIKKNSNSSLYAYLLSSAQISDYTELKKFFKNKPENLLEKAEDCKFFQAFFSQSAEKLIRKPKNIRLSPRQVKFRIDVAKEFANQALSFDENKSMDENKENALEVLAKLLVLSGSSKKEIESLVETFNKHLAEDSSRKDLFAIKALLEYRLAEMNVPFVGTSKSKRKAERDRAFDSVKTAFKEVGLNVDESLIKSSIKKGALLNTVTFEKLKTNNEGRLFIREEEHSRQEIGAEGLTAHMEKPTLKEKILELSKQEPDNKVVVAMRENLDALNKLTNGNQRFSFVEAYSSNVNDFDKLKTIIEENFSEEECEAIESILDYRPQVSERTRQQ